MTARYWRALLYGLVMGAVLGFVVDGILLLVLR